MADERFERLFRLAERFAAERDELSEELEFVRRALAVLALAASDGASHKAPIWTELEKLRRELGDPKIIYDNPPGGAPSGRMDLPPRPWSRRTRRSRTRAARLARR